MRSTPRRTTWLTPLAAAAALAASAAAEERFWTEPIEGLFGDAKNWNGGVPIAEDIAVFDLDAAPLVRFEADRVTDRIVVRRGLVTFEMDGGATYTLDNPLAATPGITVGETDMAELRLGSGTWLGASYAMVGLDASATGTLVVENDGMLDVIDELRVADQGAGSMIVGSGGRVISGVGAIGVAETGFGAVDVTGDDAVWDCVGPLTIAGEGIGNLSVSQGGVVLSGRAILGRQFGALAEVEVSGFPSFWRIAGSLDVGQVGVATMRIEDEAAVEVLGFATIGTFPWEQFGEGGVGTVTVDGAGSTWIVADDLSVGFLSSGTLILGQGGSVHVGGDLLRAVGSGTTRMVIDLGSAADYSEPALDVAGATDDFEPTVRLVDGYAPGLGDAFEIAAADEGVGDFEFTLPALDEGLGWRVIREPSRVALAIGEDCGAGDVNLDGVVDFGDVLPILAAWGPCTGCREDADGSGVVDFGDILVVLADWGSC